MSPASIRVPIVVAGDAGGLHAPASDVVAVEEPLEIRAIWEDGETTRDQAISVTMRTPGNDEDLAVGFLYTEGVVSGRDDGDDVKSALPFLRLFQIPLFA